MDLLRIFTLAGQVGRPGRATERPLCCNCPQQRGSARGGLQEQLASDDPWGELKMGWAIDPVQTRCMEV